VKALREEKQLKLLCSIILVAAMLAGVLTLTACSEDSDGSGYNFVLDLVVNPRTLDPQTAVDRHAQQIILNIFDGLLRTNTDGEIVAGVAREFSVSDDLLTYTFYLREDVFWSDAHGFHAPCTAHDFVFGFTRLFNPEVRSRNSPDYFAILNSRAIREGEMPLSELGVSAEDDFTLVIQLEEPDSDFLSLLTKPPAFPANEEFFIQTAGRYGLVGAVSPVASNGAFVLSTWVYDPWWRYENRIILRRNEYNNHSEQFGRIYPAGISFLMDRGRSFDNFAGGYTDCIVISGDGVDELIGRGFSYTEVETSVWGISFNTERAFGNEDLRRAVAFATDSAATGIELTGYRAASGHREPDPAYAAELFRGVSHLVSAAHPVLIVPITSDNDAILSYVRSIVQQWQYHLGLFCEIVPLTSDEFARRVADGEFDIAASGVHISSAVLSETSTQITEFIPFAFMSEYFFTRAGVKDLEFNPFSSAVAFWKGKMFR
jgi:oligopeptide transport system substrate-binding protein